MEQYKCPSYYDDDGLLRDCKCGKCGYDNERWPFKSTNEMKKVDSVQKKYLCGDASLDGSVKMTFQGGCRKEVDLEDSYRCTGCGGRFHLACIEEHFELEEDCDVARVALKKLERIFVQCTPVPGFTDKISEIIQQGLKRKSDEEKLKETITTT